MVHTTGRITALIAVLASAACGGGGGGSGAPAPTPSLSAPTNFRITQQRVHLTSNEVQLAWTGNESSYRVYGASTPGGSDLLTQDTTGTTLTWMAPRDAAVRYVRVVALRGTETSSPAPELPVYMLDLRNVIDALFFDSGPMADNPDKALSNPLAGVWADGSNLSVLVSTEAGETARSIAQVFATDYSSLPGSSVSASLQMTTENFRSSSVGSLPPFTIAVRLFVSACGGPNVLACASYGPFPLGPNRSIVTMNSPNGAVALSHEMGHSYGMSHVHVTGAVRPELNFLMNPALVSQQLTEPEKTAITAALQGGIRGGWRRDQALAAGLVLPYPPTSAAVSALPAPDRNASQCKIIGS